MAHSREDACLTEGLLCTGHTPCINFLEILFADEEHEAKDLCDPLGHRGLGGRSDQLKFILSRLWRSEAKTKMPAGPCLL